MIPFCPCPAQCCRVFHGHRHAGCLAHPCAVLTPRLLEGQPENHAEGVDIPSRVASGRQIRERFPQVLPGPRQLQLLQAKYMHSQSKDWKALVRSGTSRSQVANMQVYIMICEHQFSHQSKPEWRLGHVYISLPLDRTLISSFFPTLTLKQDDMAIFFLDLQD